MRPFVRVTLLLVLLLAVGVGAVVLTNRGPGWPTADPPLADPAAPAQLAVVTSTNVYASVAAAVGGDRVRVLPLVLDANQSPRDYQVGASDARTVADAKVVVYNGDGYDSYMDLLLGAAGGRPVPVNVSRLSGLVPADGTPYNEHFWYSLPTMQALAPALAGEFSKLDPAGAAAYSANAATFTTRVGELATKLEAIRAKHPAARVVVTDTTPGYLVEAAGLADVIPERFDVREDGPPAQVVDATVGLLRPPSVLAVLVNPQHRDASVARVEQEAAAAGVPVVAMTETIPPPTRDYLTWMTTQIDRLSTALDHPTPTPTR